jgi:hypothetical protein
MRVGTVLNRDEHLRKCWCCQWTYGDLHRPGHQTDRSLWTYEKAVEAIESTSGPFTRPDLWRAHGGGPSFYNILGFAIHDMRMHGLLRCVRMSGKRCMMWEVQRGQ